MMTEQQELFRFSSEGVIFMGLFGSDKPYVEETTNPWTGAKEYTVRDGGKYGRSMGTLRQEPDTWSGKPSLSFTDRSGRSSSVKGDDKSLFDTLFG